MRPPSGLIIVIALALARAAFSEPPATNARVRALFESGQVHYNLTEYREALADFTAAYRLKSDPVFLFNIAQCHRQLGEHERAAQFYRNYLREARNVPNRAEIEKLIADAEAATSIKRAPPAATMPPSSERNQLGASTAVRDPHPSPPKPIEFTPPALSKSMEPPTTALSASPETVEPAALPVQHERPRPKWILPVAIIGGSLLLVGGAVALGVGVSQPDAPDARFGTYTPVFK